MLFDACTPYKSGEYAWEKRALNKQAFTVSYHKWSTLFLIQVLCLKAQYTHEKKHGLKLNDW